MNPTDTQAGPNSASSTLNALRRKLEGRELKALRELVVQMGEELQKLEALYENAEARAEMWEDIDRQHTEEAGQQLGLTKEGQVLRLPAETSKANYAVAPAKLTGQFLDCRVVFTEPLEQPTHGFGNGGW